jgi:hypothetical protein
MLPGLNVIDRKDVDFGCNGSFSWRADSVKEKM